MTLMAFSIVPLDKGSRYSKYVAGILDIAAGIFPIGMFPRCDTDHIS